MATACRCQVATILLNFCGKRAGIHTSFVSICVGWMMVPGKRRVNALTYNPRNSSQEKVKFGWCLFTIIQPGFLDGPTVSCFLKQLRSSQSEDSPSIMITSECKICHSLPVSTLMVGWRDSDHFFLRCAWRIISMREIPFHWFDLVVHCPWAKYKWWWEIPPWFHEGNSLPDLDP